MERVHQENINVCAMKEGGTEEIGETSFRTYDEKYAWKSEWYIDTIVLPFEDTTVTCPIRYEDMLRKQ